MATGESSGMAAERPPGFEAKPFPVGMRVVAIDDDRAFLAKLNGMLTRCEYKVTCFSNAVEGLKMIRENKDEIDLVITDVQMPEIDGFKILEVAGLELDLPVIMLSGTGTKEMVMKGIMHGACDYLIKPVRLEELSVIWKHVVKRQKSLEEFEEAVNLHHLTIGDDNGQEDGNAQAENNAQTERRVTRSSSRLRAITGKRRKEDSDEGDDPAEMDDDEKSTRKKPRVVWSPDLHRKFVNAVSEIGVDKAVPKSILEKMNIEKLTRENVASHLQKYRLYLKRLNSNPQDIQAAFGSRNSLSVDLRSFERFKSFHLHGRYRPPVLSDASLFQAAKLNNTPNSPSPSAAMTSNSNFNLTNNIMSGNQMNLYKGVTDHLMSSSFPGTSNRTHNSYMSPTPTFPSPAVVAAAASEPLPIAPFGYRLSNVTGHTASLIGPHFGASPKLIRSGNPRNSVTEDSLQRAVSSLNNSWIVPNPNVNVTSDLGTTFFNNVPVNVPSGMSSAMGMGMSGGIGTSIANGAMSTTSIGTDHGMRFGIASSGVGTDFTNGVMGMSGVASGGMTSNGIGMGMTGGGIGSGNNLTGGLGMGTVSSGGIGTGGIVSDQGLDGFGMANFGAADSEAGADHTSSISFQGGDDDIDIPISGIDELLASLLMPGDGTDSFSFMDDDFFD